MLEKEDRFSFGRCWGGRAEGLSSGGLTGVEPVDLHGLTGSEIERRMVSRSKNFRG